MEQDRAQRLRIRADYAFRIFMARASGDELEVLRLQKNQRLSELQRAAWARGRGHRKKAPRTAL